MQLGGARGFTTPNCDTPTLNSGVSTFSSPDAILRGRNEVSNVGGGISGCRGERRDLLAEVSFQDQLTVADTNIEAHRTCG